MDENKQIKELQEIIAKQQREIDRQAAVNEIVNIMNRYEYYLGTGYIQEVMDLFALKQPDVRAEMMWGVYEGAKGIEALFVKVHGEMMGVGKHPGGMAILTNTTHVIEVAGDGKTAKAVWICPGIDTGTYGGTEYKAHWGWAKRAADFIKEDGKWKIWHYHVYGLFFTPYERSWIQGETHPDMDDMPDDFKANKPPTTHWFYSTDAIMKLEPVPPVPYETFDPKTAY